MLCTTVFRIRFWGVSERQWAFIVLSSVHAQYRPSRTGGTIFEGLQHCIDMNTCGFVVHRCRTTLRCHGRVFAAWIPYCQPYLPFVFIWVCGSRSCIPARFQTGPIYEDCPKRNAGCPGSFHTKSPHLPFSCTISFFMHRTKDWCVSTGMKSMLCPPHSLKKVHKLFKPLIQLQRNINKTTIFTRWHHSPNALLIRYVGLYLVTLLNWTPIWVVLARL